MDFNTYHILRIIDLYNQRDENAISETAKKLTDVGKLMGCSRQNIKKLALALGERHLQSLKLLFSDFSEDEIKLLLQLYTKLFAGMERVEKYAEELGQ